MPILAILSIAFTVIMLVQSFIFRIAGKIRLTLPVIFFLLMAFPFNKWASAHETLVGVILGGLVALCLLSWIISLVKGIREKRGDLQLHEYKKKQMELAEILGISLSKTYFDEYGRLTDQETGEPVQFIYDGKDLMKND